MTTPTLFPPDIFVDHLLVALRDATAPLPGAAIPHHQHARQAAAIAKGEQAPGELVAAALLAGIGQVIVRSQARHPAVDRAAIAGLDPDAVGVDHLRLQFPESVARPVGLQPRARRYLHDMGRPPGEVGRMTQLERARFEADPHGRDAVWVATTIERAGRVQMLSPPLDAYRELLHALCTDGMAVSAPRLRLIS